MGSPRGLILLLLFAPAGCDWLPEQLGGPTLAGRIVEGPLPAQFLVRSGWADYPHPPLGREGLRLFVDPSFGEYHYRLDMFWRPSRCAPSLPETSAANQGQPQPRRCFAPQVRMLRVWRAPQGDTPPRADEHRFFLPEEDFRTLLESYDANARGWRGERLGWTDGTDIAVERVRDGVVTSVESNSQGWSQRNPAVRLLGDVQRLALAYGPTGTVPRSYSWHVQSRIEYPCADIGLNTPDPDGFGVGNDVCAQEYGR